PARPGPARAGREAQVQRAALGARGPPGGGRRRLDRARLDDPQARADAVRGGRARGAPARVVAADHLALLLRDRHGRPGRAARGRAHHRGGAPAARRDLARVPLARGPRGHRRAGRGLLPGVSDGRVPDRDPRRHAPREAALRVRARAGGDPVSESDEPLTYAGSGVSLEAGEEVVARIRAAVTSTHGRQVLGGHGGFAGLYTPSVGDPLVAAGCDGVGTKVLLGRAAGRHAGLGIDLVAELVEGIADGCRQAGCALLGGETAEHPDMMKPEEYDLAGFCVALAERRELVSGSRVQAGDAIVGLPSSGPHSNGFSLVRRLLERAGLGPADAPDGLGGATVADALLEPTRIYARPVAELCRTVDVRAMAHITGGGIPGNLARQFPAGLGAEI